MLFRAGPEQLCSLQPSSASSSTTEVVESGCCRHGSGGGRACLPQSRLRTKRRRKQKTPKPSGRVDSAATQKTVCSASAADLPSRHSHYDDVTREDSTVLQKSKRRRRQRQSLRSRLVSAGRLQKRLMWRCAITYTVLLWQAMWPSYCGLTIAPHRMQCTSVLPVGCACYMWTIFRFQCNPTVSWSAAPQQSTSQLH